MHRRTEELAAVSEIKHTAYSPADVMTLFGAFQQQAADALLFVKCAAAVVSQSTDEQAAVCLLSDLLAAA
jgi:hypothetical protein